MIFFLSLCITQENKVKPFSIERNTDSSNERSIDFFNINLLPSSGFSLEGRE